METANPNYVGSIIENDVAYLHSTAGSRSHFENFKRAMKQAGIQYSRFEESPAQILRIDRGPCVYFTGGTTWWGFQKKAIQKMQEGSVRDCVLLIYASKDPHYWWIDLTRSAGDAAGRWLFSEPSAGKLQTPPAFPGKIRRYESLSDLLEAMKGGAGNAV